MKIIIMAILFFVFGFLAHTTPEQTWYEISMRTFDIYLDLYLEPKIKQLAKHADKVYVGDVIINSDYNIIQNCSFLSIRKRDGSLIKVSKGTSNIMISNNYMEMTDFACKVKQDLERE